MLNWLNFGWSRWDSAMVTRRNHNFVPFWIKASGRWMKRDEFFPKFWKLWVCMFVVMWCFFQEISEKHEESIGVGRREFQITHSTNSLIRRLVRELLFKRSNGSFQLETEENGTVESWQQSEDANSTFAQNDECGMCRWWFSTEVAMYKLQTKDYRFVSKFQSLMSEVRCDDVAREFLGSKIGVKRSKKNCDFCVGIAAVLSRCTTLKTLTAWKEMTGSVNASTILSTK